MYVSLCIRQIDVDGDGQISFDEFQGLIVSLENEKGGLRPKVSFSISQYLYFCTSKQVLLYW